MNCSSILKYFKIINNRFLYLGFILGIMFMVMVYEINHFVILKEEINDVKDKERLINMTQKIRNDLGYLGYYEYFKKFLEFTNSSFG